MKLWIEIQFYCFVKYWCTFGPILMTGDLRWRDRLLSVSESCWNLTVFCFTDGSKKSNTVRVIDDNFVAYPLKVKSSWPSTQLALLLLKFLWYCFENHCQFHFDNKKFSLYSCWMNEKKVVFWGENKKQLLSGEK